MARKGSPILKYPWKTTAKELQQSYDLRMAACSGDGAAKTRLQTYNRRRKERSMEASNKDWVVEGKPMTRYQCMDYIVTQVAAGEALPLVCQPDNMPSMQTVYGWFKHHPDFEKAMREAEEIRGHILGERALEIVMETDRENVAVDKLKAETLSKFAARANNRFQDKQTVQTVDEFSGMSDEQIRTRIKALLNANPDLNVLGTTADSPALLLDAEEIVQPALTCVPEDLYPE